MRSVKHFRNQTIAFLVIGCAIVTAMTVGTLLRSRERRNSTLRDVQRLIEIRQSRLRDPGHPSFEYVRDAESQKRIRSNIENIKLGLTSTQVKNLLGEPSEELTLQAKPKTGHVTPRRKVFRYYFKRLVSWDYDPKYDTVVELFFNEHDHLTNIGSTVVGISSVPAGDASGTTRTTD
jgi:hypothetical protein